MATEAPVGPVVALWRYPVKSMQGEELNASAVTERGLRGDRAFALLDAAEGWVASAKNPRKWPHLFDFRAAYAEPPRGHGRCPRCASRSPTGPSSPRSRGTGTGPSPARWAGPCRCARPPPSRRCWRNTGRTSKGWTIATP